MNKNIHLPKRERQALEAVYTLGSASVRDVMAKLPDGPSYAATRMILQRLHKRGMLEASRDGARYLYTPSTPTDTAGRDALQRLLNVFFDDSPTKAISALLADETIDEGELAALEALVAKARRERRAP